MYDFLYGIRIISSLMFFLAKTLCIAVLGFFTGPICLTWCIGHLAKLPNIKICRSIRPDYDKLSPLHGPLFFGSFFGSIVWLGFITSVIKSWLLQ